MSTVTPAMLTSEINRTREWCEKHLGDKVRVEEVQDALRKLTDVFNTKMNAQQLDTQKQLQVKGGENMDNVKKVNDQFIILSRELKQS